MLSSTQFFYADKFSGDYGLLIAEINQENIQESTPFVATIHTTKASTANRFTYTGVTYDEPLTKTFHIFSADGSAISDTIQRELTSWLFARKGFQKLQFLQPDLMEYEYNCIFGEVGKQFVNGFVVGYILTATFDSHFAYGKPRILKINSGNYELEERDQQGFLCKIKMVGGTPTYIYPKVINESDIVDDWTYPIITFTTTSPIKDVLPDGTVDEDVEKSIIIVNKKDNDKMFKFEPLGTNEKVEVDNETKVIKHSNDTVSNSGDLLSKFNKNWFRLQKGVNEIKVKINGQVEIICPQLALIGW